MGHHWISGVAEVCSGRDSGGHLTRSCAALVEASGISCLELTDFESLGQSLPLGDVNVHRMISVSRGKNAAKVGR